MYHEKTIAELNTRIDGLVLQIDELIAEIQTLSARLQAVLEDNEKLTQENVELSEQLSERPTPDFRPSKLAVLVSVSLWIAVGYAAAIFI